MSDPAENRDVRGNTIKPHSVEAENVNANSVNTENLGIGLDVSNIAGDSLAHRIENAVTEYGVHDIYVPPTDSNGNTWQWTKSLKLTTVHVNIYAVGGAKVNHTVTAGNGPVLHLNGGDHRIQGLRFRSANAEVPDYGVLVDDASETKVSHCFVQDADIGFEIRTGSFKSTLQWCRTDQCKTNGINVDTVSNCTLRQCYVARTDGDGIRLTAANGITLRTCSTDKNEGRQLLIDNCDGYGVYNLTCEVMNAANPAAHMVSLIGSTNGVFMGGFLDDGGQGLFGFRVSSGWNHFDGMQIKNGATDQFEFISSSVPGDYGFGHPILTIGGGWRDTPTWTDSSAKALVYVHGNAVIPTNLIDVDEPAIRFEGEERFHDGSGAGNPKGPARAISGSWVSMVDGSTIS